MSVSEMYTSLPGRIVSYNPEEQTATVRISVERTVQSSTVSDSQIKRGLLEEVPIHTLAAGSWALTMDIEAGDTCAIFFSQQGYDHWLFNDKDEAGLFNKKPMPWIHRKFDVQDGYALVGFNTIPRAIKEYQTGASEWRNVDRDGTNPDRNQRISLVKDGTIHIKTGTTTINLTRDGAVTLHTDASLDITAVQGVNLTTPNLYISGDVTCGGEGLFSGDLVAAGISVSTHDHAGDGGIDSGGSTGGPR